MQSIIEKLKIILADSYSLYLKTQNYHWNIRGPHFAQLHLFLESQYKDLADAVDLIAEKLRSMNVLAPASFEEFADIRTLSDGSSSNSWQLMIEDLSSDHKKIIEQMKALEAICQDHNDPSTADMLIERVRGHEQMLWMLSMHLQN